MDSKISGYNLKSFPYSRKNRRKALSASVKLARGARNCKHANQKFVMERTKHGGNRAPMATDVIVNQHSDELSAPWPWMATR